MESTSVQKIARVLHALVLAALVCNLIMLPLVPGLVLFRFDLDGIQALWRYDVDDCLGNFLDALLSWWYRGEPYTIILTLFLLFSGICTAVILWQGLRVLDTILRQQPFSMSNAVSLRRAAGAAFVISGAALARVVFSVCFFRSAVPLLSYNALFVPIFAMFGLLCLVMSALFRQAAEIKAENDLTI
ncbi:DUF2975 domain-containing protein [uncultured Oscillibacter sp.]|uniref:DUF2975 domain-containing protein n=1 Tax=uncultured Oscillibacter sp. TaxID=876091 RepID=UPI0025F7B23C|nr:DUF2975 domain-containing protein [uncultured Oscillibacter sp.]